MTIVYIISAPSGSGKSTLVRRVLAEDRRLLFSVSYTTRPPRGAEKPGESYHFISREEFEERIRRQEFLEWAEVFGHYYGTHRSYLERARVENRDLLLDIDVQGARKLKREIPDAVSIFILAPSRAILEQRLRARSEDSDEVIARRLREAREEIRNFRDYDYVLVNREVDTAAADLAAIIRAERLRRSRVEEEVLPILASFEAGS
jgi:guanylate kinase